MKKFWDRNYRWSNFSWFATSVEALCPSLAFTAWDPQSRELVGTDWLGDGDHDRFNGLVTPSFGDPAEFVASLDGEHL